MPGGSTVVNSNAQSIVWNNYVDLNNDVKGWMQIPASETTWDVQMQLITDAACQWAQKKLGRPIAPTQFVRKFNGWAGWNGAYIMLPYAPVLEVNEVIEYWGTAGPHVLSEQTFTNQVDGFQCNYQDGTITRVFPGLVQKPWFPGSRNIEIRWTAGQNPVNADLKMATLEFIAHWFRNTQQQMGNTLSGTGTGDSYDAEVVAQGEFAGEPLRIVGLLAADLRVGIG